MQWKVEAHSNTVLLKYKYFAVGWTSNDLEYMQAMRR